MRKYNFIEGDWSQKGGDIDDESAGDESGKSLPLSANSTIASVGVSCNDGNGDRCGQVRIYNHAKGE